MDYSKYMRDLPVIPDVAAKIMGITEDKIEISFRELENLIKIDPGLSAKILKIANSALYARQKEIKSLQMAITLLGFKNIKSIVLLVSASNLFSGSKAKQFYKQYWKHSIITAFISRDMAIKFGYKSMGDDCFVAGLLHDIGQVVLFNADNDGYQLVLNKKESDNQKTTLLEEGIFDIGHKKLGKEILKSWNFPDVYTDTALEHGSLNIASIHKTVILIVSAADILSSLLETPSEIKEAELLQYLPALNISAAQIDYFRNDYLEVLSEDPLFTECETLFNIR